MAIDIDPDLGLDELFQLFDEAIRALNRDRALEIEVLILRRIAARQDEDEALELELKEQLASLDTMEAVLLSKSDDLLNLELGGEKQPDGSVVYPVWYATNRKPLSGGNGFTGERHSEVSHGRVEVYIPESHKFGETGSGLFKRLSRFELKDDSLQVQCVSKIDSAEGFYRELQSQMNEARDCGTAPHALIYIHGYRNSFEDAAIRAAQIGYDLNVTGATAFFSWPSRGSVRGYTVDEASIGASERAITDFLVEFSQQCGADKIHVVAHSMGNRGFLRALQRIAADAETRGKVQFGQIFLAAPDVDRDLFLDLADLYSTHSERTTLYASDGDMAVMTSSRLHDAPRAGYYEPHTFTSRIDSILVPDFDIDLLGHSYFAQAEALLYDMAELMNFNMDPKDRMRIDGPVDNIDTLWRIKK